MGYTDYNRWINGDSCCCANNFVHIEHDCSGHTDACSCENILKEIANLHTDDLVLQGEIDELSGCCSGGSGSTVTVDNTLSPTSTNPVANSAITDALNDKLDASAYTPVDLSDYAKKEDIPVIPTLVSSFINDAGYLTEHQSLSGYATNASVIQNVTNLQQQIDSLIAAISGCCQPSTTLYRWVTETGDDDYWCSGTTKYSMEQEESSTDGITWTPTGNERSGSTVLEENCVDCGYVPPTPPAPSNDKAFVFNRYEGDTTTVNVRNFCDSGHTDIIATRGNSNSLYIKNCSTTIDVSNMEGFGNELAYYSTGTSSVIQDGAFSGTDITQANIYSGCTGIGKYAFANNPKLTFVGMPADSNYVTSAVTFPTIVNGTIQQTMIRHTSASTYVGSIDDYAFANCPALEEVVLWPCLSVPTLGTGVFNGCTGLKHIYVPSNLVNAFKQASGWSAFASKISAYD